jgi:hypothetical protein
MGALAGGAYIHPEFFGLSCYSKTLMNSKKIEESSATLPSQPFSTPLLPMYLYNSVLGDMLMRVLTVLVDEICGRTRTIKSGWQREETG